MLVLTRKRWESIKIGNDIVIKVLHTGNGTVKLGIEAPANVRVLRAELTEFATSPIVLRGAEKNGAETEAGQLDAADSLSDEKSPVDFSTEFAVEIEDQMLCAAGH